MHFKAVTALLMTVTLSSVVSAADWPEFMGPSRNHISQETQWTAKWSGDPKILWKADIGVGFSAFAIMGNRAWTVGFKDKSETIYCFDALTGETKWSHTYPAQKIPLFHIGGPNAAPTVRDGKVYSLSKDGQLFCLNANDGKVVWKTDLVPVMELEKMTRWGFSSAPWIDGDHILLHTNRAVAIDRNTGSMVWRSEKSPMPGYSSLALFTHNNKRYLSAMRGDSLVVFDRDGGTVVATYPFKIEYNLHCITPMAVKESDGSTSIFIAASNKGGRCEKLRFDGKSLKRVYQNEVMRNFMNNSVLIDGYLYGVDGKHKKRTTKFVCMRYSDGKMMWEHKGLGCGSVISANGKLIILSEDGRLVTAEASPKGFAKISEAKILEGTCWTPPSLANGLIYARNQEGQAVCVDLRGK